MKPNAVAAVGATTAAMAMAMAVSGGCVRADAPRPPGPLASAVLALDAELGADPQAVASAWIRVKEIAGRVGARRRSQGGDLADNLNAVVMGELRFEREVDSPDLTFMLVPSVVSRRRGSCLGLGALYLMIAERLDEPLQGVLVPGHFFVRAPGPPTRNLELLRRGEAMPDEWYREKYGPWPTTGTTGMPGTTGAYARPLSILELGALHWFNAGNQRRRSGDLRGAERAYARAAGDFPTLAEAHASLGAMLQLRGALDEARGEYQAAARARADLPGLTQNIALLEAERASPPERTADPSRSRLAPSKANAAPKYVPTELPSVE